MIITEKQLIFLCQVLVDSLAIVGRSSPFVFSQDVREKIYNEIFNQQSNKFIYINTENTENTEC